MGDADAEAGQGSLGADVERRFFRRGWSRVGRRGRWGLSAVAIIVAVALVTQMCAVFDRSDNDEVTGPGVVYVYDEKAQLKAVTDPERDTAVFSYDAVGNRTAVDRYSSADLSVIQLMPTVVVPGAEVVIHGTGFDPADGETTVQIGGVEAEVIAASPVELTVVAPNEAESGPVTVSTSDGSADSREPLELTPDRMPSVEEVSPLVASPGDEVTIRGENFTGDAMTDLVVVGDATYLTVESTSETEIVATVPPVATSGAVSVATPAGTADSGVELYVAPEDVAPADVVSSAGLEVDESASVDVPSDGEVALLSFHGTAGQRIGLKILRDGHDACSDVDVALSAPGGRQLIGLGAVDSARFSWCGGGVDDAVTLPANGSYTMALAGRGRSDDTVTVAVADRGSIQEAEFTEQNDGKESDIADSDPDARGAPSGGVLDGVEWLPVDIASGTLLVEQTDLVVPDLVPIELTRNYQATTQRSGRPAFGLGSPWDFDVELDVERLSARVELRGGAPIDFTRVSAGYEIDEDAVFEHRTTSSGFYGARIAWNGTAWELTLMDGSTLEFEERSGALSRLSDASGNELTVLRPEDRDSVELFSPAGRWVRLSYDDDGRISEATSHLGDTARYRYGDDVLVEITYTPRGDRSEAVEITYTHDDDNSITSIAINGDSMVEVGYDSNGRVVSQTLPDGSEYTFSYTTEERQKVVQFEEAELPEAVVDIIGQPEAQDPVSVDYDAVVEAEVTDPTGSLRRVMFDEDGHWTSDTRAVGTDNESVVTVESDAKTGFITATDATGYREVNTYDDDGHLVSVTTAAGTENEAVTRYEYDSDTGQMTGVSAPVGSTSYAYDDAGNVSSMTGPDGTEVAYTYDGRGRLSSIRDAQGEETFTYELAHRMSSTDASGNSVSEFYDAAGKIASRTDEAGRITTYRYGDADQLVEITDPAGGATIFDYDRDGNLTALTDANGNSTAYTHDELGRIITRTDPDGRTDEYEYDDTGNLTAHTDRRGLRTTIDYDSLGRQVEVAYGVDDEDEPESTVEYSYDNAGHLAKVDDSTYGVISYSYDDLGRLTSESTPDGELSYRYDDAGRRSAMVLPDGTETIYRYTEAGQLESIDQPDVTDGGATVSANRDEHGRVEHLDLPNGIAAAYTYDEHGQIAGIDYDDDLGNLAYGYDPTGRVNAVAGELAGTDIPAGTDGLGYDNSNRLTDSADDTELVYDESGNLVDDGVNTYTWDARGQLVAIDGDVHAEFKYDPFGRRVTKTIDGDEVNYVYEGDNIAQQHVGDRSATTYLGGPGLDEVYARTIDGQTSAYVTDAQGSVLGVAGADGEVTTGYSYSPFGQTSVTGADDPNPFAYTGRELDETGLYYYRARYYDPAAGRFISEDPLGYDAGDPNLYRYAAGDPTNLTDPTGESPGGLICLSTFGAYGAAGLLWIHRLKDLARARAEGDITDEEYHQTNAAMTQVMAEGWEVVGLACAVGSMNLELAPAIFSRFGIIRGTGYYVAQLSGFASPRLPTGYATATHRLLPGTAVGSAQTSTSIFNWRPGRPVSGPAGPSGTRPTVGVNCTASADAQVRPDDGDTTASAAASVGCEATVGVETEGALGFDIPFGDVLEIATLEFLYE